MTDKTPIQASHDMRLRFEGICYALLPGLIVAFMLVLMIGVVWPPPAPCLPDAHSCVAAADYGRAVVDKGTQIWPVLLAALGALIGAPAVTLFRGAHDAKLGSGEG